MDRYDSNLTEELLEKYISLHSEIEFMTSRFRHLDKSWRPEMKTFMSGKKAMRAADLGEVALLSKELQKLQDFGERVYPRLPEP